MDSFRRRHRDRRQRVLRPRHGHPPEAGGERRLRGARARRRRRRHLALQHLSRLRLRRALPPLLVLVRAEPRVERDLLPPARDPRLPPARGRRVRRPPARAAQQHGRGHAWDEDGAGRSRPPTGRCAPACVVAGMGPLAEPKIPDVPGLDEFEGETLHSARWNHDYDLSGKRVASIGTGASAIQYVPGDPAQVEQLHVFQRTPPWVLPHPNREIRGWERRLYKRFPRAAEARARRRLRGARAARARLRQAPEADEDRRADRAPHIAQQIADPELREKVTPDYTIGCKRILPSNKWYPALSKPNVELVTDGVEEVTRNAVDRRRRRGARGRRDHLRHRLPGHRHAGRQARARPRRQDARRRLAGQPAGAPRHRDARLPQPVHAARPEHRAGPHLDGLHDRVADRLRARRAARMDATAPTPWRCAPTRPSASTTSSTSARGHGVEHRLRPLVPRRHRAQRDAVARLDVPLPPADRAFDPATTSSTRPLDAREVPA